MATKILDRQIDVVKVLFEALLPALPETTDDTFAVLKEIDDQISYEQHERLYSAVLTAICDAQEIAFRAGWEMRGKL
jgi:hypothetical protein